MSSQRYTRWRTADDESDDPEENGNLTEQRDEDENESRRVFTLMTPSRDSAGAKTNIFSRKFVFLAVLLCTFCLFGGAFLGFYVGRTNEPWPESTEVKPTPVPSTVCDHPDPFEDIPAMSMKLLNKLKIRDLKKHISELSSRKPVAISSYIRSALKQMGYYSSIKSLVYSVSTSYHQMYDPSTVSILYKNATTSQISSSSRIDYKNRTFTSFNSYSANGSFSGPLVYGHFGTEKDMKIVQANNITLNNSILIVRQGKLHPSVQVRNAEKFGVKALLLYPEPEDFGGNSSHALPEDAVITQSLLLATGDPATVGYASEKSVYRLPASEFTDIPRIPVQSISSAEAKYLFSVLAGPNAPNSWRGQVSPENTIGGTFKPELNISSVNVSVYTDIGYYDVKSIHAFLPAEDLTRVVHIGTHFDESLERTPTSAVSIAAWLSFAGALKEAFPNGTRRMVLFSAFPGTQGDYSGGGEYTELFANWIHTAAMAYVDFDDILRGAGFIEERASHLMKKVVKDAYHHVEWPQMDNTSVFHGLLDARKKFENESRHLSYDFDEIKEATMCGDSTNFYAKHGVPTLSLAAVNVRQRDFYRRNSQYDELKEGIMLLDPDLQWTHMISSLLSICSIILLNSPVPPVEFENYARHLKNEWSLFTLEHNPLLKTHKGDFSDLIEAISGELDVLSTKFESLDNWYSGEYSNLLSQPYRHEESLLRFMIISRYFLRPAAVPSPLKGSSLLTFGPDMDEPCKGVSFPMARKVLYDIKRNESSWTHFERELSLILSAISSYIKIGSHNR